MQHVTCKWARHAYRPPSLRKMILCVCKSPSVWSLSVHADVVCTENDSEIGYSPQHQHLDATQNVRHKSSCKYYWWSVCLKLKVRDLQHERARKGGRRRRHTWQSDVSVIGGHESLLPYSLPYTRRIHRRAGAGWSRLPCLSFPPPSSDDRVSFSLSVWEQVS